MKRNKRTILSGALGITLLALLGSALLLQDKHRSADPKTPLEKITIDVSTTLNTVLMKVAESKGFLRQEGFDVTFRLHTSGKAALESLLQGESDFATVAETPIVFAVLKGSELSVFATIQTSTKNEAIIARKDLGIASAADLKGRRVGVTLGTTGDYYLDLFLVIQGMTRKDVTIVDLKPEEMTNALVEKKVDAVSTWAPLVTNLRKALGDHAVMLQSEGIYTETFNVVSSKEFPRQHPETIKRLLRALAKAEVFAAANPEESQNMMSEFSGIDQESLADIWNDFQFNLSLNQSLLFTLEDQARWAVRSGLTQHREIPNFLESLYFDGLQAVKPESVRVIR